MYKEDKRKIAIIVAKGTIYIGIYAGIYITEYFAIKALAQSGFGIVAKIVGIYGLIGASAYFGTLWGYYGLGIINGFFREIEIRNEEKRDLRKKAEANGWDIVECCYTVEEWKDQVAK